MRGCTHLTEMLAGLPTAAIQTFAGEMKEERDDGAKPFQLDQCHALETTTETVRMWYPKWYESALPRQCRGDRRGKTAMKIHEYQGKEIFRKYGVPTPRGFPAFSVDEAVDAAKKLGGKVWVVKAQIHAGGRGKGGGVKVAKSLDEVAKLASADPRHAAQDPPDRARRARRCAGSWSRRAPTSGRSSTSAWWSTAARRRSC